jgi:hypothetical protein
MGLGLLEDSRNTVDIWMHMCLLHYTFKYTIIMIIEDPLVNILTLQVFINTYIVHIKPAATSSTCINCAFY